VSEPDWLPWTALRPSALRQRLLRLALALTLIVLAATTVAAWLVPDALRLSAFYLAGAGFLLVFLRLRSRQRAAGELRVTAEGEIWRRDGAHAAPQRLRASFVSPLFAHLTGAGGRLTVWADALPREDFRRLLALLRWSRTPPADRPENRPLP
jgi:hypothetical protein